MNKILLIILSFFLPPLAVYLKRGADKHIVINIILCFVFWVPAVFHSLWVVVQD
ncbi:YqaE/Pmp3 family membrane protein [Wenyingzhuangia sp. 2_MG-2023]|uniref:YqaE/Pmp3 family membrane protein n=1 Tax=Wenyingzhuangia sp. 2_MG-2023 TaxID=3062639 RepID=UPI0026E3CB24|nr:YqaE/Pmp3 family membrane protein [Wenyingzhuangia sp. 2_MG-2023]MDO6738250.1 YqaE/Pmp3 family membrane protein [Wenyingzhuangia sp. 2_MG-2023]MDO6802266.1 YqaE/Pmp3 family membrane protein [Wenyingzhuangia sp. 1_MG-2023]